MKKNNIEVIGGFGRLAGQGKVEVEGADGAWTAVEASEDGKYTVASGARVLECACGPCIGMGFSPNSGGVSLRTFNRNFAGRTGTKGDQAYLERLKQGYMGPDGKIKEKKYYQVKKHLPTK